MNIIVSKYISSHPEICHGAYCFRGTRIMVYLVLELLEAGYTPKQILEGYPQLTKEHLTAAFHFAAEIMKKQKHALRKAA